MAGPELHVLALAYWCLYNLLAAIVTATLAPRNVAPHVVVFAAIGFVLGTLGVVVNYLYHLGPAWYPILLALSALRCTWIGAKLYEMCAARASAGR